MAFIPAMPPAPFVYFSSLADVPDTAFVWSQAVAEINKFNNNPTSKSAKDRKDEAVKFLKQTAEFQRKGEIAFVKNYENKLKKMYQDSPSEELQAKINELSTIMNDLYKETGFDYYKFTEALNIVTKESDNLKGRLSTLLYNMKHKKREHTLLTDINKEYSNIVTLLNTQKNNLIKEQDTYEAIVSEFIFKYVKEHEDTIQSALLDDSQYAAWLLKLSVNFRAYMEKTRAIEDFPKLNKEYEAKKKYLEEHFKNFTETSNILEFSDQDKKTLSSIASNMEFQKVSEVLDSGSKRAYIVLPSLHKGKQTKNRTVVFTSNLSSNALSERLNILAAKFLDSFLQTGGSNMGDDSLGAVVINWDSPNYQEEIDQIDQTLRELDAAMTKFSKIRTDREKVLGANATMNKEIEDALKKLDKYLGDQDDGQKAFIIHDSDKYYYSIEQGFEGAYHAQERKRIGGFGGRTMSILNYIDTMSNLSVNFGVNPSNFYFAALNLSPYTAGQGTSLQTTLEEIFTYAAGMIMFDDVAIAVKESTKALEFSNITNIHLYQLQGLFFPSSYILQQTANYLAGCDYDETDAAVAQIQTHMSIYAPGYENLYEIGSDEYKSVDRALKNFITQDSETKWNTIKDEVSAQTKVSIHFFLNFQNFISQIPH